MECIKIAPKYYNLVMKHYLIGRTLQYILTFIY